MDDDFLTQPCMYVCLYVFMYVCMYVDLMGQARKAAVDKKKAGEIREAAMYSLIKVK